LVALKEMPRFGVQRPGPHQGRGGGIKPFAHEFLSGRPAGDGPSVQRARGRAHDEVWREMLAKNLPYADLPRGIHSTCGEDQSGRHGFRVAKWRGPMACGFSSRFEHSACLGQPVIEVRPSLGPGPATILCGGLPTVVNLRPIGGTLWARPAGWLSLGEWTAIRTVCGLPPCGSRDFPIARRLTPAPTLPPAGTAPSVAPPVITGFVAAPPHIEGCEQSMLSWVVKGATKTSLEPGYPSVDLKKYKMVSPRVTTQYLLKIEGPGGIARGR
jgi:hypothetical protein